MPEVAEGVRSLLPEESRDRVTLDEMLVAWYRSDDRLTDQMIVLGRDIMRVLFEQAGVQNGAQPQLLLSARERQERADAERARAEAASHREDDEKKRRKRASPSSSIERPPNPSFACG